MDEIKFDCFGLHGAIAIGDHENCNTSGWAGIVDNNCA